MWGACVGVYKLLNWKMPGETLKSLLTVLFFFIDTLVCLYNTHLVQINVINWMYKRAIYGYKQGTYKLL